MTGRTVNIEPHWESLRRYVLAMFETEPEVAREIAEAMGCEAPELPGCNVLIHEIGHLPPPDAA